MTMYPCGYPASTYVKVQVCWRLCFVIGFSKFILIKMAKGISEDADGEGFSTTVQGQEVHPLQSKRDWVKRIMYMSISRGVYG